MNWVLFLAVLISAESGGNPDAVGDIGLQNKAYGVLQIRKPYLDDVNRITGRSLTMRQVRRNETIARWCVVQYLKHYGARYERITDRPLNMEAAVRIHNGGPDGWKKDATDRHWHHFKRHLRIMTTNEKRG